ncbi:MAG: hypothetical protein ABI995_02930, partial [Acidobacteriota bacterium]
MSALFQQARLAIGFKQQTDLVTPLLVANLLSLQQTNEELFNATPINQSNVDDLGKGTYPTALYPSHWEAAGPWDGRLTSEAGALLAAFGIGAVAKVATTATGGFKYTADAPDLNVTGLDMPSNTVVVQMGDVRDILIAGMCCDQFGMTFRTGAGRDNATFTSRWVGTGQNTRPSAITMPAPYDEHSLNAGGISALTLIGFNYITNKRFGEVVFNWQNQIDLEGSRFPGSGSQGGFQIGGRMRRTKPLATLTSTVEAASGSSEEDLLLAGTSGTGVITCLGSQIAAGPESHEL